MQIILYLVVLISGASILLRKGGGAGSGSGAEETYRGEKGGVFPAGDRNGNSVRGIRSGRSGPGHARCSRCWGSPHIRRWECPCSTPYLSLFLRREDISGTAQETGDYSFFLSRYSPPTGSVWRPAAGTRSGSTRTFSSGSLRWDLSPLPWSSCFSDWSQGCRFAVEAGGSR